MLSTVLDRLTSLTSKYFVVSAFVPVLAFAFVNGALMYGQYGWFQRWVRPQVTTSIRAFDLAIVLIFLAVAAYVLSAINGFLRQLLEARYVAGSSRFGVWLRAGQVKRYHACRQRYLTARTSVTALGSVAWAARLAAAAKMGAEKFPGRNYYAPNRDAAGILIPRLAAKVDAGERVSAGEVQKAAAELETALAMNDVNVRDGANDLAEDRRRLLKIIDAVMNDWSAYEVGTADYLQARFGVGLVDGAGSTGIAATAFGNVAASMDAYAMSRYRVNLNTFWSRLQSVVQEHAGFFATLQEAKAQLDFLVSIVWLAAITTAVWLVVLPATGHDWRIFLAVAAGGPLVMQLAYRAAIENYVAFGEIVRTAIDLYRLELLDALSIARPMRLAQERELWEALQRITTFGQGWVDISYQPPKGSK